jgi:subtilisin-like proprotein convertase family protein
MPRRRPVPPATAITLAAVVIATLAASGPARGAQAPGDRADSRAAEQIAALQAAKLAFTPAERKLDSGLLAAARLAAGRPVAPGVPSLRPTVPTTGGIVSVVVRGRVTPALVDLVGRLGGRVTRTDAAAGLLFASLPVTRATALAASPDVRSARPDLPQSLTASIKPRPDTKAQPPSPAQREQRRVAAVARSLAAAGVPTQGRVVSEGDRTHAGDVARGQYRVFGAGPTVGVLSDGVDSLADSQASGDLPPEVTVLPGRAGQGDEGTAMLEIVHDLAPAAKLAFATIGETPEEFAAGIRALRAAGADVLVDDVAFFDESPFQDGPIARAVNDVTARGALYFSSAGNEGNLADGTSGVWEGDFVDSGRRLPKYTGRLHDFDPGPGTQVQDPFLPGIGLVTLHWADPIGRAGNDYDLFVLDLDGNVVAFSNQFQTGRQDPYERADLPFSPEPLRVAVVKFRGADRFLHVSTWRGRFAADGRLAGYATDGQIKGHAAAVAAVSVGAAPAAEAFDTGQPTGPFPGRFTRAQLSETFTSDGLRRVFYRPDGTAITPGNFTATGGTVRRKPTLTAADGVVTSLPGFGRFYGTSAAAPHAAALAALLLSGRPSATPADVRQALAAGSVDIEAAGYDRTTGFGIPLAHRALAAVGAPKRPNPVAREPRVLATTDGDRFVEPGETAQVAVPVDNVGGAAAFRVSVRLATGTPGVTVLPPAIRGYGTIPAGGTGTSPQPFRIRVGPDCPCGQPIALTARVSYASPLSPTTSALTLPTGRPGPRVDRAYTGPPVPIPDVATVEVPLAVSGVGPIADLTVSIDGTECTTAEGATTVGIDHTFVADLGLTLTSPAGTQVQLFADVGGSGNNLCQVVLRDDAATDIAGVTSDDAPFTGSYRPFGRLADLTGETANGTWTLTVVDDATADTGSVRAWSLLLRGYVCD